MDGTSMEVKNKWACYTASNKFTHKIILFLLIVLNIYIFITLELSKQRNYFLIIYIFR